MQKLAVTACANRGKPCVITRVLDSMVDAPRPTRAEATDVANAVLDGCDGFLLGAETLRGAFPVETVRVALSIAHEAERVFNSARYYKRLNARTGGPQKEFSHVESLASSAVRAADKVAARLIVVFTQTGRAARLVAKYRPQAPILCVVVPKLLTDGLHWQFTGLAQARQALVVRGLLPVLADPAESFSSLQGLSGEEFGRYGGGMLGAVVHRAGSMGLCVPGDRVVVVQRLGDTAVVKIVEYSGNATLPQVHSTAELAHNGLAHGSSSGALAAAAAKYHALAPLGSSGVNLHFPRHSSAASSISEEGE